MNDQKSPKQRIPEKEAAPYIGMSEMYLRVARMKGGGPPYLKIGRAVRYDVRDLDKWLETKKVG